MSTKQTATTNTNTTSCQGKCGDTLCWSCKYASGAELKKPLVLTSRKTGLKRTFVGCPWVEAFVAVPGWTAEKTLVKNRLGNNAFYQKSYLVTACPHYEFDGRKEVEIEDIIEALNIPVRYALSNRFILWDYYDTYRVFLEDAEKENKGAELDSETILKVKIAAVRAFAEDVGFELSEGEITAEEYEKKFAAIETLEVYLKKNHGKTRRVAK